MGCCASTLYWTLPGPPPSALALQVDDSAISGVYRGTVVRGEGDLPHGDCRVTDCHEAVIYLLAPLQVGRDARGSR